MTEHKGMWRGGFPTLRGPWLGQSAPGVEAIELRPGVFSPENRVSGITFSPEGDEAFFSLNSPDRASAELMWTRMVREIWARPQAAPFNSEQIDNDIAMSPDGRRLVWRSWRPVPGRPELEEGVSLWASDRTADGWGKPFPIECDGERQAAVYPGIGSSGTLYFSVRTAVIDGEPEYAILKARRLGHQYEAPEPVFAGLSSAADLCVAPDESFLVATIFRLPRFRGQADLHVSFRREDGTWTPLRDLGPAVRTERTEYCPTISADGARLFFCRIDREDPSVPAQTLWIGTGFIHEMRRQAVACSKERST